MATKQQQAKKSRRAVLVPDSSKTSISDPAEVVEKTTGEKITLGERDTSADGEKVTVIVPKAFTLTLDDGTPMPFHAGTQEMSVEHAAHWFSRAQGVKVYSPGK
jgi:hypothetical protein